MGTLIYDIETLEFTNMIVGDFSKRNFQVWAASPSLARLVLRSPGTLEGRLNIDICFRGVAYLEIPWHLDGPVISKPELAAVDDCNAKAVAKMRGSNLYVLSHSGSTSFVVAGQIIVNENSLEIFDVPFSTPQRDGPY
jgi:hypothetical protein